MTSSLLAGDTVSALDVRDLLLAHVFD